MTTRVCDDKALLISYLYDECDESERRLVEEHLSGCAACSAELDQLRGVRHTLRDWAPPETALGFRVVRESEARQAAAQAGDVPALASGSVTPFRRRWTPTRVPAWARVAAALLVFALGAGTMMLTSPRPAATASSAAQMAALERRLEDRIATLQNTVTTLQGRIATLQAAAASPVPAAKTPVPVNAAATPRLSPDDRHYVQALVDQMGRDQQQQFDRQLAERFVRFQYDVQNQRDADMRMIKQGITQMDTRTMSNIVQIRQTQNALMKALPVTEIR